jgi:threonine/homoserine/homoserine lactone efflux protein
MDGLFAIGFAAGLALAIPVGPMAIMLINTTIASGWRHGVVGALAMSTVDGLYAATVFFLGGTISAWLQEWALQLSLGGAVILFYLGSATLVRNLRLLRTTEGESPTVSREGSLVKTFATFFGATALNPPTALYFLALAPSVAQISSSGLALGGVVFAIGVFVGSIIWQQFLAFAGVGLRSITHGKLRAWIGAFGGTLIVALAVAMAVRAFA